MMGFSFKMHLVERLLDKTFFYDLLWDKSQYWLVYIPLNPKPYLDTSSFSVVPRYSHKTNKEH